MDAKRPESIPTSDTAVQVPLAKEGATRLKAKANRQGIAAAQLIRQGIDRLAAGARSGDSQMLRRIRRYLRGDVRGPGLPHAGENPRATENLPADGNGENAHVAFALRPARMAGLLEAARRARETSRETDGEAPREAAREGTAERPAPAGRHTPTGRHTPAGQPALAAQVARAAVWWTVECLPAEDIRTEAPPSGRGYQLFEKPPGQDRGGRPVKMSITKEAKEKIADRADRFGWAVARFARLAICDVIEEIERRPTAALRYAREEREYYQPPKQTSKYQYAYQFYVGLGTKRLIEHAPEVLRRASEEDLPEKRGRASQRPKITQKRILQAAGRWAIESEDISLPKLRSGASTGGKIVWG